MIAIDTGPLVAFFDASDHYHQRSLEILKKLESPILTTWAVITETFYLLSFFLGRLKIPSGDSYKEEAWKSSIWMCGR